jgi:hypothetical protein
LLPTLLHPLPKLNPKIKSQINSPVTVKEFKSATQTMLNNKSSGLNSLGIEVYKTFPKLIKLLHSFFSLSNKSLTSTLNQGQLILIHKSSSHSNLSNYRPLTMLNTNYKIITKTLATHLQSVI